METIDNLSAARFLMAFSLGFHMIFAALGVGMPVLMLVAEGLWLRFHKPYLLALARTWAKATGILFAIGAVSGTALSFELGLLWPAFMERFGHVIGPAFTLEAFAFFIEAIFLALYLYGWDRLPPLAHWLTGIPVALGSAASSVLVVASNAWMQNPIGAELLNSNPEALNPLQALFYNPAWRAMALHSTLATYAATGFAVAAVYAWAVVRGKRDTLPLSGLSIALGLAAVAAVLMPITGDASGRLTARLQPAKFAAMEAHFETERGAALVIGGLPLTQERRVVGAVEVPGALSWLAFRDARAEVPGLDRLPSEQWPNVVITHVAFQVMVGAGVAMLLVAAWYWWAFWRKRGRILENRRLMWAVVLAGPLGFVALEAGWVVTEVGRQPWIVYGVMRTAEAVTPAGGVAALVAGYVSIYLVLAATTVWLLRRLRHEFPVELFGRYPGERVGWHPAEADMATTAPVRRRGPARPAN